MLITTSYEEILLNYNWTGNGKSGFTTQLPTTGLSAVGGVYTIGYNFLIDQNSLESAGYYDTPLNDVSSDLNYDPEYDHFRAVTSVQEDTLEVIMGVDGSYDYSYSNFFSDVASINFSSETPQNAEIVIGQNDLNNGIFSSDAEGGYVKTYVPPTIQPVEQKYGDMWLNEDFILGWSSASKGSAQFWTLLHELGHTLGLADFDPGSTSGLNNQKYSVMSYSLLDGMDVSGSSGDLYASSLQIMDIAAVQEIYGRDFTTRNTETVYSKAGAFASDATNDALAC